MAYESYLQGKAFLIDISGGMNFKMGLTLDERPFRVIHELTVNAYCGRQGAADLLV
jgi:hypothetical protein